MTANDVPGTAGAGAPAPPGTAREPVIVAQVVPLVAAVMALAAALGVTMAPATRAAVMAVIAAAVPVLSLLAAAWARGHVTPLADPRDNDGAPLIRADGMMLGGASPAAPR